MTIDEVKRINAENAAKTVIAGLKKRNMEGFYAADRGEALKIALSLIPEGSSVGWGGSVSVAEIGLQDAVKNGNYRVLDRANAKDDEERRQIYAQMGVCDFFLMSTNAITYGGELVNVDGTANRVAFLCYGPSNVIVVAGVNKIVKDVNAGIDRARNVAAPANAVRLGRATPCTRTGKCEDCQSPECICCQTVITRRSSKAGRIKVILVGEDLGL